MNDPQYRLRHDVLELLNGGSAHLDFSRATAGLPAELRGAKPKGQPHTPWRLVEHMRLAQHDILDFITKPDYQEPTWPDDYWPTGDAPPDDAAWDEAVRRFETDSWALKYLVGDPQTDLLAPIKQERSETILREALLVADHNAYHLGQLVVVRRLLGAWEE